jgi:basic membrane protein A
MKKKVFLALALVLALSLSLLTACGGGGAKESAAPSEAPAATEKPAAAAAPAEASEEPFNVALVIGVGGLGDGSFNDSLKAGCDAAVESYGITYDLIEPVEVSEFEGDFTTLCEDGSYDLIVCGGFDAVDAVSAVAPAYPEQKFLFVDGTVTGFDNVTSVSFRDHEKTFLLGMVAAMKTETDHLGVVCALNVDSLNMFVTGFIAGAEHINPDIAVDVKYVGSFSDTTTAKEMAISLFESGADIIAAFAGGSGLGVFTAAAEEGFLAIGCDTNQCLIDPNVIMLSGIRRIDVVIHDGIGAAIDGTLKSGANSAGLAENALTITNEGSKVELDSSFLEAAEEAKAQIISGELKAPSKLSEIGR